jgi:hypothetical protein
MSNRSSMNHFVGVKVFSATMQLDRDRLGDRVAQWMADNPQLEVVDHSTTQSSDNAYHCLSIVLFYRARGR